MATQRRYSDILADIVNTKHSKCTCPPEYFKSVKPKIPDSKNECCQFGPDCQFLCKDDPPARPECQYDQAKCTCYVQCICGPVPPGPVQLLQGPELDQVIDMQACICGGNCYCESDDIYRPTIDCDRTRCVCDVCLCRPDTSDPRLLPTNFRNAVKKEPKLTTDERLKQECAEIKQLLIEHEENKKRELEESANLANDKIGKKPLPRGVSMADDNVQGTQQGDNKEDTIGKESIAPQEGIKSPESVKTPQKEAIKESAGPKSKKQASRKEKTPKRKSKPIKSTAVRSKRVSPDKFRQYSCGCRMPKKKPLHIRYYFSGGTEHYGVKQGHKQCMPKTGPVPKNMGWLWNIEDPSKGIRERKGWPPGFIAKNIKDMIKVLKQFDEPAEPGQSKTPTRSEVGGKRFGLRRRKEVETTGPLEEPPLLHIHKKGRTYDITFCPKSSDTDIGPIPIPFSITEKKHDSDTSSSDSTLEFEFHSPKPKLPQPPQDRKGPEEQAPEEDTESSDASEAPPSTAKPTKKKAVKKRLPIFKKKSTDETKNLWEEQKTQIENIA